MNELTGWPLFAYALALGMLVVIIANTIPKAVEEIKHSLAKRREKRGEPIDWTNDHNLVLPVAPYFDPRVEFTEEEVILDLVEENARLTKEAAKAKELQAEVEHQEKLKLRYLKELRRAQRRG